MLAGPSATVSHSTRSLWSFVPLTWHRPGMLFVALIALVAQLAAQTAWQMRIWSGRTDPAVAFDSARGRLVMFGGSNGSTPISETWEWDGARWTPLFPATSPPPRSDHSMAYDTRRGRVVLYGGWENPVNPDFNDTWEWDGATWTQIAASPGSAGRSGHALAYDSARGKVVLFGGKSKTMGVLSDTWEYDGIGWSQRIPVSSPSPRKGHGLAYDSVRGKTILFGGAKGWAESDTWEWDGTNWIQRAPATSPPGRQCDLAFDSLRGRIVLFGGYDQFTLFSDTWEWDGTIWIQRTPSVSPSTRAFVGLAYDSLDGRTILVGGSAGGVMFSDAWDWDGSTWIERTPDASPPPRAAHGLAYDNNRRRVILFGGFHASSRSALSDTWEWDGAVWTKMVPVTSPPARSGHALAYDQRRGKVVLFGGDNWGALSDTWEWDGVTWTQRTPASAPPARAGHALAYDSARGRVVLFGGGVNTVPIVYADTWEWDGSTWTQRLPAQGPPARWWHGLAFDSARGRMVLFGGQSASLTHDLSDTWLWDGSAWSQAASAINPLSRSSFGLAYDSARRRVVLFGGYRQVGSTSSVLSDTWEWNGTQWTQRTPARGPIARSGHALAYDSMRGQVVLFGGSQYAIRSSSIADYTSDTWEYASLRPASFAAFGTGCPGSGGMPVLAGDIGSLPWLGDNFDATLTNLGTGPFAVPFVILGDSKSTWGSTPLPLDLTSIGMPGCTLYTSLVVSYQLLNIGGAATWSVPIPNLAILVGVSVFAQGAIVSPSTNPLNLVMSNAAELKLGSK